MIESGKLIENEGERRGKEEDKVDLEHSTTMMIEDHCLLHFFKLCVFELEIQLYNTVT